MTTQTETFRVIALRQGLKLLKVGIRPNTAWTPGQTLASAGRITGQTYKRGEYDRAIADLNTWLNENS
jgi:hypothetical protein